jgi:hypothetical protein
MFTINIPAPSSSVAAPIQISINNDVAAGTVMYTVPAGRKFVGTIGNTTSGNRVNINQMSIWCFHGGPSDPIKAGALQTITLVAGTVVKEVTANTSYILGVESAA